MKISAQWVKEFVPSLSVNPAEWTQWLNRSGIGVDSAEEKAGDLLLDIEITPNRGDFLSVYGVARQLAALLQQPLKSPPTSVAEADFDTPQSVKVWVEDPRACGRYCCRVIRGVKVGPSPDWLSAKLLKVGLVPINNVVDITNYVMWELGHPLHAFDAKQVKGETIHVRQAKPGETLKLLNGHLCRLADSVLVIADVEKPLAIAGIMGGEPSGIQASTVDVVLESAWFHPGVIRRGMKATGEQSDSSYRFERGTDPEMVPMALDRAAELMRMHAGGQVGRGRVESYPIPDPVRRISIREKRCGQLLGYAVSMREIENALTRLQYRVDSAQGGSCEAIPPSFRRDIGIEEDLIEDVAQLLGYDKIPALAPSGTLQQVRPNAREGYLVLLREGVIRAGFQEVVNFGLVSSDADKRYRIGSAEPGVPLSNPLRNDWSCLRSNLISEMMSNVVHNLHQEANGVAVFELGHVFSSGLQESTRLGLMLSGISKERGWDQPPRTYDLFDLKGGVETILRCLGVEGEQWRPVDRSPWRTGTSLGLYLDQVEVGVIGEVVEPEKGYSAWCGELDVDRLEAHVPAIERYRPWPKFPSVHRDLAVQVSDHQQAGELMDSIQRAGTAWLERVEVFDVYRGKGLPPGQKSVAFRLTFRSSVETLRNEQVNEVVGGIIRELQDRHRAILRS